MTALQKPSGGVRGIVVGDFVRRLVARTLAQQLAPAVELAISPFQFALTTKLGCECVAHIAQTLTDLDGNTTLLSVDGIGAFNLISRSAMLQAMFYLGQSYLGQFLLGPALLGPGSTWARFYLGQVLQRPNFCFFRFRPFSGVVLLLCCCCVVVVVVGLCVVLCVVCCVLCVVCCVLCVVCCVLLPKP